MPLPLPPVSNSTITVTYQVEYSSPVDELLVPSLREQFLTSVEWPTNVTYFTDTDVVAMSVYIQEPFSLYAKSLWDAVVAATPEGLQVSLNSPSLG